MLLHHVNILYIIFLPIVANINLYKEADYTAIRTFITPPNSFTKGMGENGKTTIKHIASVNQLIASLMIIMKIHKMKQSLFLLCNLKNKVGSGSEMSQGRN